MMGHVISWILQIWFILFFGLYAKLYNCSIVSEVASLFKMVEFCIIPLVQILTSPPLKKHFHQNLKIDILRKIFEKITF